MNLVKIDINNKPVIKLNLKNSSWCLILIIKIKHCTIWFLTLTCDLGVLIIAEGKCLKKCILLVRVENTKELLKIH